VTEIVMAVVYNHLGVVRAEVVEVHLRADDHTDGDGLAETDASPAIQLNTLALAVLAMIRRTIAPQIFTFMLLPASLALLSRDSYRGARRCG